MSKNKTIRNIFDREEDHNQAQPRTIIQQEGELVTGMLKQLVKLLHRTQSEGEYNSTLAERVIMLYMKHDRKDQITFDVYEDIGTLVDYFVNSETFENLQRALDILNLHEMQQLDYKIVKVWKVKVFIGLRTHYTKQRNIKEAKNLTGLIKRQDVIVINQIYNFCLKQLIQAHKLVFQRKNARKKYLESAEQLTKIISLIEESSEDTRQKFQTELMKSYFQLGLQNRHLHYEAYALKYLQIAYSIANRLKDPLSKQIKQQLDRV